MAKRKPDATTIQEWRDKSGPVRRITYRSTLKQLGYDYDGFLVTNTTRRAAEPIDSQLVSSEVQGTSLHAPVIDIDYPAALIPSSTPGHYHLYLNKTVTWWRYRRLLKAMYKAGLIEKGFYECSKTRGGSHLRLPWINKNDF